MLEYTGLSFQDPPPCKGDRVKPKNYHFYLFHQCVEEETYFGGSSIIQLQRNPQCFTLTYIM